MPFLIKFRGCILLKPETKLRNKKYGFQKMEDIKHRRIKGNPQHDGEIPKMTTAAGLESSPEWSSRKVTSRGEISPGGKKKKR